MYLQTVTANDAFQILAKRIIDIGIRQKNTLTLYNVLLVIRDPLNRDITTPWRKWSKKYAEREWAWYLSQDRSVEEIKKYAPIWDQMHGGDNIVNSNYGWQWNREGQLGKIVELLQEDPSTRRAVVTIYDGKEISEYAHDTPCTLSLHFQIIDNKLDLTVNMRSNDLWYGFCNDQYCFTKLQESVALSLNRPIGNYFHFVSNLHLYDDQIKLINERVASIF